MRDPRKTGTEHRERKHRPRGGQSIKGSEIFASPSKLDEMPTKCAGTMSCSALPTVNHELVSSTDAWVMFRAKVDEWAGLGMLALVGAVLFFISRWET